MGPLLKASSTRIGNEISARRNSRRTDHQPRSALHSNAHEKLADHARLHAGDHDRMRGEGRHREDDLHLAALGMDVVLLVIDMDQRATTGIEGGTIDTAETTEVADEGMTDAMTVDKLPRRDDRMSLKGRRRETKSGQL